MITHEIVRGTLEPDGTLVLDQKPNLSPGRVRVMLEAMPELSQPVRFWAMMEEIWDDLKASGHSPRGVEDIEAERRDFRDEWDERQDALEQNHRDTERLRQLAPQPKGQPQ